MKDIASILFKISGTKETPAAGSVLLAEPFLKDTFFTHGVMSVIDYMPEEGATGVILNNRSEYRLADLLEGITADEAIPVFCGGPTGQDRLYFIHTLGPDIIADARPYANGLYVGGNFDDAVNYVNDGYATDGAIRFFLGYCNWVEGQLEREIRKDTWVGLTRRPNPEDLLTGAGDAYWHRMVRTLGPDYRSWSLLPRNAVCN
ncbi:MAG: YqgE/AlgH family protein [Muribaculaceae bacterium]|nr:YqgE/AlgH family protein [Muribaculaceae bacterium]